MSPDAFSVQQLNLLFDRHALNTPEHWLPTKAQLEQWVIAALSQALNKNQQSNRVELSLKCVSSDQMRELNAQYRSIDRATNVLSFPADMPELPANESSAVPTMLLGDVVVCPEVLTSEAIRQNKSIQDHWAHMLVHSVLHLTGLDHEDVTAADAMESLEIQILSTFGIANPYKTTSAEKP